MDDNDAKGFSPFCIHDHDDDDHHFYLFWDSSQEQEGLAWPAKASILSILMCLDWNRTRTSYLNSQYAVLTQLLKHQVFIVPPSSHLSSKHIHAAAAASISISLFFKYFFLPRHVHHLSNQIVRICSVPLPVLLLNKIDVNLKNTHLYILDVNVR